MKRVVIFDFDYTLADSTPGIVDCIRTAQRAMDLPPSTADQIRPTIGLAVPDILVALHGEAQRRRAAEFGRRFRDRADQVMAANTRFYPPAGPVLAALRAEGHRVAIASTKFRYRIEGLLARDGLSAHVDLVVGGEDVSDHKPHPACLLAVLERLAAPVAAALYVGDSVADAEAARRAGLDFVAVLSGTTTAAAFADLGPVAVLEDVGHLPAWLAQRDREPVIPDDHSAPGAGSGARARWRAGPNSQPAGPDPVRHG